MSKVEIPSRRVALRGMLAIGCGLLIPAALFGCDARNNATSDSPAPASPATGAEPTAPAPSGKVTQASVRYQAQPNGENKCGGCTHFIPDSNTCAVVEGQVSAEGWCSMWTPKA